VLGKGELAHAIDEWTLIPSKGGVFELQIDGDLVYSKKDLGRHAEEGELLAIFESRLAG
jgi:selenoprotein W-related protein